MRNEGTRRRFVVDIDPIPDALLRILGPFAARQVMLTAVRHGQEGCGAWTVVETVGVDRATAELIGLRLAQMACVRSVHVREIEEALATIGA
jgi:hypothetical protein